MERKYHIPKGILFICIAAASYSISSIFVKLSSPYVAVNILLFFRYFFCFLCVIPFVLLKFEKTKPQKMHLHLIRGSFGLFSIACFFYSIRYIPLAEATLLSNTATLFIPLILRIFRGIKILGKLYWGLSVGLVGIALILSPGSFVFEWGAFIALLAALFRSISMTTLGVLAKREPIATVMFYYFFTGMALSGISLIFNWTPPEIWPWSYIFCIGLFGLGFQLCFTLASRNAPIRIVAPFMYLTVVFSALGDWMIWNVSLTFIGILGMLIVCFGGLMTVYLGKSIFQKPLIIEKK